MLLVGLHQKHFIQLIVLDSKRVKTKWTQGGAHKSQSTAPEEDDAKDAAYTIRIPELDTRNEMPKKRSHEIEIGKETKKFHIDANASIETSITVPTNAKAGKDKSADIKSVERSAKKKDRRSAHKPLDLAQSQFPYDDIDENDFISFDQLPNSVTSVIENANHSSRSDILSILHRENNCQTIGLGSGSAWD